MPTIVQEFAAALERLDPVRAQQLASLVRDALRLAESPASQPIAAEWPEGHFEATAGAFANEQFDRPPQGVLPVRDAW